MCPMLRYPILQRVLSPFRRSQQKTLAAVIAAIAEVAQATSLAVAGHLAGELGMQLGRALNRFYRLRRNPRIDDQRLTAQWLPLLGQGQRLLIALDWTEWHHDLRMLVAAVVVGCRAIPVQTAVFQKTHIVRSQNTWENTFLQLLVHSLCETGQRAVVLCDRGFRRASWLQRLQDLPQPFVVRLIPDVMVYRGSCSGRRLRGWHLRPGQAVDLGLVRVRHDQVVEVRVVGVWAFGQHEPWWLATELTEPLGDIVALYDRRMTIEEQFRDTKGCRFGVRLQWTQFRTPAYLARFTLLVGVALVLWTAVGQAVAKATPRVRLPCKRKGPRLSLMRVGIQCVTQIAPLVYIGVCFIRTHLPPPQLRKFPWLQAIEVDP
jgi:Transposase DDE domain